MKKLIALLVISISTSVSNAQIQWESVLHADSGCVSGSNITDIAFGRGDTIISVGRYNGSLSVAGNTLNSSNSLDFYFFASSSPNGQLHWLKSIYGPDIVEISSICTDQTGNIYVLGRFSTTLTAGITQIVNSSTSTAVFMVKFDYTGNVLWAKQLSSGGVTINTYDVTNFNDLLYIAGNFKTNTVTPVTIGTNSFTTATQLGFDCFYAKMDTSGNILSVARYGDGVGITNITSLDVNGAGDLFLCGTTTSSLLTIGSFTLNTAASNQTNSAFIARFGTSGTPLWTKAISPFHGTAKIAVDDANSLYIGGEFSAASPAVDNLALTKTNSYSNGVVLKMDQNGASQWIKGFGGYTNNAEEGVTDLAIDSDRGVYIAGHFQSDLFTAGTYTLIKNIGLKNAVFVAHLDKSGTTTGVLSAIAGTPGIYATSILVQNNGTAFVGGLFNGGFDYVSSATFAPITTSGGTWGSFFISAIGPNDVSVRQWSDEKVLQVYPVPVSNVVNIQARSIIKEVSIIDVTGRELDRRSFDAYQVALSMDHLSNGAYFISVSCQGAPPVLKKVIKVD